MLSLTVLIAATPIKELKQSEEKVAYIHSIDVVCYQYSAPQEVPKVPLLTIFKLFKIHKGHQHAICVLQIYYTYILMRYKWSEFVFRPERP